MGNTTWLRQTKEPLFPDVLWSQPENKRYAGKLVVIGGHKQSFSAVSEAYEAALKAGIGTARVVLPQALQNMLKGVFTEAEYTPSNSIGSFSRDSLAAWLEAAEWADGVLLAGDFGRNSETAILLESFLDKYDGLLGVTGDTIDYFLKNGRKLIHRNNNVITTGLNKLQKLALPNAAIRQHDDLSQMVNKLGVFTDGIGAKFITFHRGYIVVAASGQISTTPADSFTEGDLAAYAAVWLLQQPQNPFEALTTAALRYAESQR